MPLAFESRSHSTVAFGFFQIESHMLLLQDVFFFADDFCAAVESLAAKDSAALAGWRVPDRTAVGDLHGAMAGRDLGGFIGATYQRWPFPTNPSDFRQNPDGHQTRELVTPLADRFGNPESFELRWDPGAATVSLAEYVFGAGNFRRLLDYVARGGYPRWTDDRQPDYVQRMLASAANLW
jgi:hypothetical protein